MHAAILELLGEAGVVGPEEANVGDVKQNHGQTLQPQPAGCKMPQRRGPQCGRGCRCEHTEGLLSAGLYWGQLRVTVKERHDEGVTPRLLGEGAAHKQS